MTFLDFFLDFSLRYKEKGGDYERSKSPRRSALPLPMTEAPQFANWGRKGCTTPEFPSQSRQMPCQLSQRESQVQPSEFVGRSRKRKHTTTGRSGTPAPTEIGKLFAANVPLRIFQIDMKTIPKGYHNCQCESRVEST